MFESFQNQGEIQDKYNRQFVKECFAHGVCPVCSRPGEVEGFCSEEHYREVYHGANKHLPGYGLLMAEWYHEEQQKKKAERNNVVRLDSVSSHPEADTSGKPLPLKDAPDDLKEAA